MTQLDRVEAMLIKQRRLLVAMANTINRTTHPAKNGVPTNREIDELESAIRDNE